MTTNETSSSDNMFDEAYFQKRLIASREHVFERLNQHHHDHDDNDDNRKSSSHCKFPTCQGQIISLLNDMVGTFESTKNAEQTWKVLKEQQKQKSKHKHKNENENENDNHDDDDDDDNNAEQLQKKLYEDCHEAAKVQENETFQTLINLLDTNALQLEGDTTSTNKSSSSSISSSRWYHHLMVCAIITRQTPKRMAAYCAGKTTTTSTLSPQQRQTLVEELLSYHEPEASITTTTGTATNTILRDMLVYGGAKNDQYLEAYELYLSFMKLLDESNNDDNSYYQQNPHHYECHQRLALGAALELVVPIGIFDTKNVFVDPKQRFLHYVNAHQNGELDPMFPYFSPWEYRYIVNSDATNDDLQWGRDHLKRYRPDLLTSRVAKFTYCKEVKTDVGYSRPEWDFSDGQPKNYRKLLSGGGKCGPRAWMGRFLCKAFGMPTFGCRQPGHAAMIRFVPDKGWITVFGGGIHVSWWEDRDGIDFQYEANARLYERDPQTYFQKMTVLECMAMIYKVPINLKRGSSLEGHPRMVWCALIRARRRDWSERAAQARGTYFRIRPQNGDPIEECQISKFVSRKDRPKNDNRIEIQNNTMNHNHNNENTIAATIVSIPACAFVNQKHTSCLPSFDGGGQIHFEAKNLGHISYRLKDILLPLPPTLPTTNVPRKNVEYTLRLQICTVHKCQENESFEVSVNGKTMEQTIPILYTMGEWQETKPILIELIHDENNDKNNTHTLQLKRLKCPGQPIWGISMKRLTLQTLTL